jgi:membrane-associated protein
MEFLDPVFIIKTLGLVGIFAAVFAESGLLIGFMLPGDSLLFTAGFMASQGLLPFWWLTIGSFLCAILGDNVGYAFGKRMGPKVFTKEDSWIFHKKNLERSSRFYEKHGPKAIVLARFMPVIRTFAPILAGVGLMRYQTFLFYNVIGAFLWAVGIASLGYLLGSFIPGVDQYLLPIILVVIFVSVLPGVIHTWREYRASREA